MDPCDRAPVSDQLDPSLARGGALIRGVPPATSGSSPLVIGKTSGVGIDVVDPTDGCPVRIVKEGVAGAGVAGLDNAI